MRLQDWQLLDVQIQHRPNTSKYLRILFEQVWHIFLTLQLTLLQKCASPRKSIWFTRPFLLMRGWDQGTRLAASFLGCPCMANTYTASDGKLGGGLARTAVDYTFKSSDSHWYSVTDLHTLEILCSSVCLLFSSGGLLTYFWYFCESSPIHSTSV